MISKLQGYLIAAIAAIIGILLALLEAFSAGVDSHKAKVLQKTLRAQKELRDAENAIDNDTQVKIDEIRNTKQSRGKFTQK